MTGSPGLSSFNLQETNSDLERITYSDATMKSVLVWGSPPSELTSHPGRTDEARARVSVPGAPGQSLRRQGCPPAGERLCGRASMGHLNCGLPGCELRLHEAVTPSAGEDGPPGHPLAVAASTTGEAAAKPQGLRLFRPEARLGSPRCGPSEPPCGSSSKPQPSSARAFSELRLAGRARPLLALTHPRAGEPRAGRRAAAHPSGRPRAPGF